MAMKRRGHATQRNYITRERLDFAVKDDQGQEATKLHGFISTSLQFFQNPY